MVFLKKYDRILLSPLWGGANNALTHLQLLAGYNLLHPAGAQALVPFVLNSLNTIQSHQLNQSIDINGVIQGGSLLYFIASQSTTPFLAKYHHKITIEGLNRSVTFLRNNEGASPFYHLAIKLDTYCDLIKQLFKNQKVAGGLTHVITASTSDQGLSAFYPLCASPVGLSLIDAKWDFFKDKISAAQLHQQISGDGESKGQSPFSVMQSTVEGRLLINEHKDFFDERALPKATSGTGTFFKKPKVDDKGAPEAAAASSSVNPVSLG